MQERVEAKGKIKRRHLEAIEEFKEWAEKHPTATREECIQEFDTLVDSHVDPAQMREIVNAP